MSENLSPRSLRFNKGVLTLDGIQPDASPVPKHEWVYSPAQNQWVADACLYPSVCSNTEKQFSADEVGNWQELPDLGESNLPALRPDQNEAVNAWLKIGQRGMIYMPTGTGKTEVALKLIKELGVSTLIVSPFRDLMHQWHRRIKHGLGYDAGIIGDNHRTVKPLSVTTYRSASIHMPTLGNRFEFIVFDEVHNLPGRVQGDAARMSAARYRLGLTATPFRTPSFDDEMARLIGPIAYDKRIAQAAGSTLAQYHIVKVPVYMTDAEQDLYDELSKTLRDHMAMKGKEKRGYNIMDLSKDSVRDLEARRALRAYHKRLSMEDRAEGKLRAVEDVFQMQPDRPTIIFTGTNAMARAVSLKFMIPCLLSHCAKEERDWILTGFKQEKFKAVVACQILDEGVDLPSAKVGVILGGSTSILKAEQRLGRLLRLTGNVPATLYEVFCQDTSEVLRSRKRRKSDAYQARG
jgi:superfamily II DNA or RNA helicase